VERCRAVDPPSPRPPRTQLVEPRRRGRPTWPAHAGTRCQVTGAPRHAKAGPFNVEANGAADAQAEDHSEEIRLIRIYHTSFVRLAGFIPLLRRAGPAKTLDEGHLTNLWKSRLKPPSRPS
jgi:hypothetical protein